MSTNNFNINRVITTGRPVVSTNSKKRATPNNNLSVENKSFNEILRQTINENNEITFSKHALQRIEKRNINISTSDMEKLKNAVNMANKKGVKDSLVLLNNTAFIVNVPSKTVVTAVNEDSIKDNVFTNINGAVIL